VRLALSPRIDRKERETNGRWKALAAALVVAGVVTSGATGGAGVVKLPLYGNYAGAHCDGSGVTAGSIGGYGFARIRGDSTIRARVRVTGISPHTTYYVRLIQGAADCGVTDATFLTNGHGIGHVTVHEASVSSHVYVFIEDGPASQFYVTETYFH
jgi:hypothetical protein